MKLSGCHYPAQHSTPALQPKQLAYNSTDPAAGHHRATCHLSGSRHNTQHCLTATCICNPHTPACTSCRQTPPQHCKPTHECSSWAALLYTSQYQPLLINSTVMALTAYTSGVEQQVQFTTQWAAHARCDHTQQHTQAATQVDRKLPHTLSHIFANQASA